MSRVLKKAKFLLEIGQFADTELILARELKQRTQPSKNEAGIFETLAVSQALQGKMLEAAETLTHIVNASTDSKINISVAVADIGQYRWLNSLQQQKPLESEEGEAFIQDLRQFYSALDLGRHEHIESIFANLRSNLPENHFILNQCHLVHSFCSQTFETVSFLESVRQELFQNFEVNFAENVLRFAIRSGNSDIIHALKKIYQETGAADHSQITRVLCHSL